MSRLDDIDKIIISINDSIKKPIHKEQLMDWLNDEDLDVIGATINLLTERKYTRLIEPPIKLIDYYPKLIHYLERCIKEDPDAEWAVSRYEAAFFFQTWFKRLWRYKKDYENILQELKQWIQIMYLEGNRSVRTCIITGILEHLFENKKIAGYFKEWRNEPELANAYEEAIGYSFVLIKQKKRAKS